MWPGVMTWAQANESMYCLGSQNKLDRLVRLLRGCSQSTNVVSQCKSWIRIQHTLLPSVQKLLIWDYQTSKGKEYSTRDWSGFFFRFYIGLKTIVRIPREKTRGDIRGQVQRWRYNTVTRTWALIWCRPMLFERKAPRILNRLYWPLHCIIAGVVRNIQGFFQWWRCRKAQNRTELESRMKKRAEHTARLLRLWAKDLLLSTTTSSASSKKGDNISLPSYEADTNIRGTWCRSPGLSINHLYQRLSRTALRCLRQRYISPTALRDVLVQRLAQFGSFYYRAKK